MISVHIKLFAIARELAGNEEITLQLPVDSTATAVLEQLVVRYPALRQWKDHLRLAVNNEYVSGEKVLCANDEIAVIPPVSGG